GAAPAAGSFSQGFETDNTGWNLSTAETTLPNPFLPQNDATRVTAASLGLPNDQGSFVGMVQGNIQLDTNPNGSAFTPFGTTRATGYSAVFPAGGYSTALDIYLNL